MQKKHVKILLFIAALVLISTALFSGCGNNAGPDGAMPANVSPRCYLANIPTPNEEYSINPTIYWYATDEDGFIKKFRYVVKKAEDINDDPLAYVENVMASGNYDGWTVIFTDSLTPGKSATSDTIPFFAVADPAIYTPQYFFVQAIDNEDAPSNFTDTVNGDINAIAFRKFSRNDHPPETHMSFDDTLVYFSLADTTATYKGVQVSWSGSDSLDYKRTQPPFEYHWRVFGPFSTKEEATTDDPSKFIYESYDSVTADVWVPNEAAVLFDLYRNEPAATVTRANYFLFEVRARDDAFVPDPTPATIVFYAVEPGFEKGLLLVDNNSYVGQNVIMHSKGVQSSPGDTAVTVIQNFYKSVFQQAGYTPDTYFWYFFPFGYQPTTKVLPGLDTLLQYKYIVLLNENNNPVSYSDLVLYGPLSDYMNLGGRVVFIGWNTFTVQTGMNRYGPSDFANKYFGISAEYRTDWSATDGTSYGPDFAITPEEMVQAEAIVPDVPQVLEVDSANLHMFYVKDKYSPYKPDSTVRRVKVDTTYVGDSMIITADTTWTVAYTKFRSNYPYRGGAEPWVSYYVKSTASEAVYISRSIYSSKAIYGYDQRDFQTTFKGMESIDGRVCGVRLDTDVYKTAAFGFSLYCMPEAQAVEFIRSVMGWLTAQ